jgi:ABC-type multidrug transport system fused ATPase/permease subunit
VAYYNELSTGVLVSRFANDSERVKRTITDFFPVVIESIGMVGAGLWFLFATSWTISLYLCSIVPLTYAVSYYQAEIFELFEERNQTTTANMTSSFFVPFFCFQKKKPLTAAGERITGSETYVGYWCVTQ